MKKFEYNLPSHTIYGSFDYGHVVAVDKAQALLFAKSKIASAIDRANKLLGDEMSIEVDLNSIEVKEVVNEFNLIASLEALSIELDGQEINGLIFVGAKKKGDLWNLHFKNHKIRIACSPFVGVDGIQFGIRENGILISRVLVPCKRPTNDEEFEEWKKFYIGQLTVVQGKFATVNSLELNDAEKTYTVEGFLIPKQTNKFDSYSDWNCLGDLNGQPLVDCQIDCEYDTDFERYQYSFQYVDYNFNLDAEEGESKINLDDTAKFGGGYIPRDYRSCEDIEFGVGKVNDDGVYMRKEYRNIRVGDRSYEVHIEVIEGNGRCITQVFAESGLVSEAVRDTLDKYIETIEY